VFLVDTYDTLAGTGIAAEVARAGGLGTNAGIRLDSGDLAELAFGARRILDAAGLPAVRIVASGGLDEHALDSLVRAGAPIDAYGVGTKLGTSADAPYLDTAYKLVEYDRNPVFKLSPGKQTMPGRKQVFRGPGLLDRVGTRDQVPPAGTRPLLQEVMRGGERVLSDSLAAARARCAADLAELPDIHRRLREPVPSFAECTPELLALAQRVGALAPDPSS
jgi:nicotinate phosphoribosyltransferase